MKMKCFHYPQSFTLIIDLKFNFLCYQKTQVNKGSKLYKISRKLWLQNSGIEIYSADNKEKYVVAVRFIKNFKNEIYKDVSAIQRKCMYICKLQYS